MNGRAIGVDLVRVAARARGVLDAQATAHIAAFVSSCEAPAGGFRGRGAAADLYYTLFAVLAGGIVGTRPDRPRLAAFLEQQTMAALDLPHLAALLQCQRLLHRLGMPRRWRDAGARALAAFRTPDHGFASDPGGALGTAYGLYLAVLTGEAIGVAVLEPAAALAVSTELLRGELARPGCCLSPLAAATLALQAVGGPVPTAGVRAALAGCRLPDGGYRAHVQAAGADLLSTAVAAFTLRRLGAPLAGAAAAATAHFVQRLWAPSGGFCGAADDPLADCEYTFYALLTLGALEA